jgi:HEAT repeat protein
MPQDISGPAALLQASLGTDDRSFALLTTTLVAGGPDRRAWAARLAGYRAQPEDIGLLAALARDTEPNVRASAADALTRIVADGPWESHR